MRRGFTLVEMLVATALVMLIMLLFAEIFDEAITTMRAQRGIIANDEKARAITQTLRTDLNRATYRASVARGATLVNTQGIQESPRGLVPLGPGDRPDPRQRGFFYFSENDPLDDGDDVLHLTVSVGETLRDPLVSDPTLAPYQGRAVSATVLGAGNLNQPDIDDGQINGAGASRAAEVAYFLRGTTLYRRVQLIRDPLPSPSPPFPTQPTAGATGTGAPLLPNWPTFYHDFDYAATNINTQLHFHGLESLDNSLGLTNSPLAAPGFRFGHRTNGQPREFDDSAPPQFFGRFTHQETADPDFTWPGLPANPADSATLSYDTAQQFLSDTGAGIAFDSATNNHDRDGEDILLTGVEAFNIEVWDPGFREGDFDNNGAWDPGVLPDDANQNGIQDQGIWVNLGNNTATGLFTQNWTPAPNKPGNATWGRRNAAYGPGGPAVNHVFDTWHPALGPILGSPPYRPLQAVEGVPLDRSQALPNTEDFITPNGVLDAGEDLNQNGVLDLRVVYYPDLGEDQNGNGALDPWEDVNGNMLLDAGSGSNSIGYVALNGGTTGPRTPEWSREPGTIVTDGGVLWQCFDNRIGLEKMRITIRFRDPGTGQPRQVTLVHSFVE